MKLFLLNINYLPSDKNHGPIFSRMTKAKNTEKQPAKRQPAKGQKNSQGKKKMGKKENVIRDLELELEKIFSLPISPRYNRKKVLKDRKIPQMKKMPLINRNQLVEEENEKENSDKPHVWTFPPNLSPGDPFYNGCQDFKKSGFVLPNEEIQINGRNLMNLPLVNKKDRSIPEIIGVDDILENINPTAILSVVLSCPFLMTGREGNTMSLFKYFLRGQYMPPFMEAIAYQWMLVELVSIYLSQFVVETTGEILWVEPNECPYLRGFSSIYRNMMKSDKPMMMKLRIVYSSLSKMKIIFMD